MGVGISLGPSLMHPLFSDAAKPAILGGTPMLANKEWPRWPKWIPQEEEEKLLEVLRSGIWSRADVTNRFEQQWAETIGTKRCLTVVNGTNALITTMANLGIGEGDEVIVPPYTFIATVMAVLANGALPVFADVEQDTFQIDPEKIVSKITPRTKAIMPVHIAGLPADMGRIMAIGKKHNLLIIEDACQAHLAEYNHKRVGSIGDVGCFSFQNSKNLPIGEGGAIVSNDEAFMDRCYSYHNLGLPYGTSVGTVTSGSVIVGTKVRLTEYQAAIGLAMLKRLEAETSQRHENAVHLNAMLMEIPGVYPCRLYDQVTKGAYHLYPFRYVSEEFEGLSRDRFMEALRAEGVPSSAGYDTITDKPYLEDAFKTRRYQLAYPAEMIRFDGYKERNRCSNNEVLCNEQAVWFTQNMLLGPKSDMELIASAIKRIRTNAKALVNA